MRVSNNRYSRDLRSIDLAHRMLGHEARTQTIRAWTTLSGDRVRNLCRNHGGARADGPRHRGPSPSKLSALLSTARMRGEAAAAAALCRNLDVIPREAWPEPQRTLPGIARGERLCYAYELFKCVIPQARLTLEQLVLIVLTLADGESWGIDHCASCHATILTDRLSTSRSLCTVCEPIVRANAAPAPTPDLIAHVGENNVQESPFEQRSLF